LWNGNGLYSWYGEEMKFALDVALGVFRCNGFVCGRCTSKWSGNFPDCEKVCCVLCDSKRDCSARVMCHFAKDYLFSVRGFS
jgi:hypothetical protein